MKTIYTSNKGSDFAIVDVNGVIYAVDEDRIMGGLGKYKILSVSKFQVGSNEFIEVSPDGDVIKIDSTADDCVFLGDFEFDEDAEVFEDLF